MASSRRAAAGTRTNSSRSWAWARARRSSRPRSESRGRQRRRTRTRRCPKTLAEGTNPEPVPVRSAWDAGSPARKHTRGTTPMCADDVYESDIPSFIGPVVRSSGLLMLAAVAFDAEMAEEDDQVLILSQPKGLQLPCSWAWGQRRRAGVRRSRPPGETTLPGAAQTQEGREAVRGRFCGRELEQSEDGYVRARNTFVT